MPKRTYECDRCGEKHDISLRDFCDEGPILTVCPKTNKGVYLNEK